MKNCRYYKTKQCPFDDSDQGPPFAGSISSCQYMKPGVFCYFYEEIKNHDSIYKKNIRARNDQHPYWKYIS